MTATHATPSVFLDRPAQVNDRVRIPRCDSRVGDIGHVVNVCTDPIDAGMVSCEVPGIAGLVRVRADQIQVLAGAA